jgi:hypothetical protein
MESYGHNGAVVQVHPKDGFFPHYMFGPGGKYIGKW